MAHFKFEGDTKDVRPCHLEFISSVLKERGFKNETVHIEAVGKEGDNFVSTVKRFIINKDGTPFKMIAKLASDNEIKRKTMNTPLVFYNENLMYTEVLPKFSELEKEIDLPEGERLRYATCYGTFMEEPNEVILLEDLCESNFTILNKHISFTSDTIRLVLKSLAKMHSLSYVLKYQEPETFEHFSKKLHNIWELMESGKQMKTYMSKVEDTVISMLDIKYKNLVKGSITQMNFRALENIKYYKESNCSVIQQGDIWTNNIMVRTEGQKAVECCLIDYQLSYQHSPVADLHYMIFTCTDYETRSKNYHDWIDYYYTELTNRLSKFGLSINDFYPSDRFYADLKREANVSIGQSITMASILMRDPNESANISENFGEGKNKEGSQNSSKLSGMGPVSSARFKDRIEGYIKSFQELEYL